VSWQTVPGPDAAVLAAESQKEADMNLRLQTMIDGQSGLVYALVPGRIVWDLIEYLNAHRTRVRYGYAAGGFTLTFLHLDQEAAQRLLDEWTGNRDTLAGARLPAHPAPSGPTTSAPDVAIHPDRLLSAAGDLPRGPGESSTSEIAICQLFPVRSPLR
jgi:hypothetical protein